jgi:hypothetical protein
MIRRVEQLALAVLLLAFSWLFCGSLGSALAMDSVTLRRGDVGKERDFLNRYVKDERKRHESDRYPRGKHLYVGRFDLNDDGQYELFVWSPPPPGEDTGTAPIFAGIFQKIAGEWARLGVVDFYCRRRICMIDISEERSHGWRTILGVEHGLRFGAWTEEHIRLRHLMGQPVVEHSYVGICLNYRCALETEESYWGPLVERPSR